DTVYALILRYKAAVTVLGPQEAARWTHQVVQRFADQAVAANQVTELSHCGRGFDLLADLLRPHDAAMFAAFFGRRLVDRSASADSIEELAELTYTFDLLAQRMDPEAVHPLATRLAQRLVKGIPRRPNPTVSSNLGSAMGLAAKHLPAPQARRFATP